MICGMYNALPLHLAPHHIMATTFYIASFHIESTGIIPNHTTFHVTPFVTTSHISYHTAPLVAAHHYTLQYHISNRTTSATLCITPLTSRIGPHFILLTYHITPHSMYSTPHQFPITPYIGHIIYASHYRISHHILHNIAPHFTCSPSCSIPPHLTVITPNSTSHCHVSHNIPHHRSVHHHLHISHNTTSTNRYRAVSQPTLYLFPHGTTFHIPCDSTRTNSHYTTTFHNLAPF